MNIFSSLKKWYSELNLSAFFSTLLLLIIFQLSITLLSREGISGDLYMKMFSGSFILSYICTLLLTYTFLEKGLRERKYSSFAFILKILVFLIQTYILISAFGPLKNEISPNQPIFLLTAFQLTFIAQVFMYHKKFLGVSTFTAFFYITVSILSYFNIITQIANYYPIWYQYIFLSVGFVSLSLHILTTYQIAELLKKS